MVDVSTFLLILLCLDHRASAHFGPTPLARLSVYYPLHRVIKLEHLYRAQRRLPSQVAVEMVLQRKKMLQQTTPRLRTRDFHTSNLIRNELHNLQRSDLKEFRLWWSFTQNHYRGKQACTTLPGHFLWMNYSNSLISDCQPDWNIMHWTRTLRLWAGATSATRLRGVLKRQIQTSNVFALRSSWSHVLNTQNRWSMPEGGKMLMRHVKGSVIATPPQQHPS